MSRKPSPGETIRHSWEVTITGGRIELVGTKKTATVGFGRTVRVGTGESSHIVVHDSGVSCVHVEIMATPDGIRVQDLSTNGCSSI